MNGINIKTSQKVVPMCYAYTTPEILKHNGWTKIGFTEQDVETRIRQQTQTANIDFQIEWKAMAIYDDGSGEVFMDHNFHAYLKKEGIERRTTINKDGKKVLTEWFHIVPLDSRQKFMDFKARRGILNATSIIPYQLRMEQEEAVKGTIEYFQSHENGEVLWNAKPRFGKTLSTYDLAMKMEAINILVVTNRPAIVNSWYEDYVKFVGTKSGYYFVSNVDAIKDRKYVISRENYQKYTIDDQNLKGCIEFVSLQDIKGSLYFGGEYDKLAEISDAKDSKGRKKGLVWDLLVIDEAHEGVDTYKTDVAFNHILRKKTLHLSGTPFKALANDKFKEEAIYNWTYADEQRAKRNWNNASEQKNPYEKLPKLNLFTYQMSEIVRDKVSNGIDIAGETEEYAFDLNELFKTNSKGEFNYDVDVEKFLDALTTKTKFPFSTLELRNEIKHTFWLLNRVDSAKALAKKLEKHSVFSEYKIVLAAGDGKLEEDDDLKKAYSKVVDAIKNNEKTITLSVGQLTTGVTIPEWTAVLMLSNMKSPALYMQAAFRAQNPCLFNCGGQSFRKKNAYVFDFDPARTLDIFAQFANDLSSNTSAGRGDSDTRKQHVMELLNFFPVYGEDEQGEMINLDAEKVLSIPRRIHAREVVARGFMSNFLFQNIGNIFNAPKEVIELIQNFQPVDEPKRKIEIDPSTVVEFSLDGNGEVSIPKGKIIGIASDVFGDKIYSDVANGLKQNIEELVQIKETKSDELEEIKKALGEPISKILIDTAKEAYGRDLKKSIQKTLEHKIEETTDYVINGVYGDYSIAKNQLEKQRKNEVENAKPIEIKIINQKYNDKMAKNRKEMFAKINEKLRSEDIIEKTGILIVETVETKKKMQEKDSIEDSVRDHLRGFSRTIPSFLMAYGTEEITLENFDMIIPDEVFKKVTSISLKEFCFLRDGGPYTDDETGEKKQFGGHLFDEIVFDDSIKEFLNKKKDLADYFDESSTEDIFDYIPPQKTNQIYTPKNIVKEMVDDLQKEDSKCFDNPDKKFIDLYMKSGLYITQIVKRLYQNENMKRLYPDKQERLNHIFAKQVYGLAPTEIIYRIALAYILGFDKDVHIEKYNFAQVNALLYVQDETLEKKLDEIFG